MILSASLISAESSEADNVEDSVGFDTGEAPSLPQPAIDKSMIAENKKDKILFFTLCSPFNFCPN